MNAHANRRFLFWTAAIVFILLAVLTGSASAAGSGGQILQANEEPRGYSLTDAAAATAYFNAVSRNPAELPADFPFQVLYTPDGNPNSFTVKPGTMFYVPIVYSDDRDKDLWPFPDVTNPAAVSAYYFDANQMGAEYLRITVDGRVTNLGRGYAVGALTPGIAEFDRYTVAAAFLSPMSKGTHTVTIAARFSGADIQLWPGYFPGGFWEFEVNYTVTVE